MYDYLSSVFSFLISSYYTMTTSEANVIIPMLCKKMGNKNVILKNKIKALTKQCFELHNPQNCINYIIDFCNTNDVKASAECLDEVHAWITDDGLLNVPE